ncbi:5-methylcytosine-specific restriction enzyme B [compost metagenome]
MGHSYVTPVEALETGTTKQWFRRVVDTEIAPLLEEYWFDEPPRARQAVTDLLHGW